MHDKLFLTFIFIILHEFFHYLIAKRLGSSIINFKIHPLGATLEIEDYEGLEINDEILICFAGPIFNLVVSCISFILLKIYGASIFYFIFEINLTLGLLNLLPIFPLDGSKILRAILSKFFMYKRAHKIVMVVSFILSTVLLVLGGLLISINIININLIILGAFFFYTAYTAKERTMYIVLDQIISKSKRFKDNKFIENKDISVYYKEDFIRLLSMIERNKFNTFHVLNENMEYLYELREDEVVDILKKSGNMTLEEYYNSVF